MLFADSGWDRSGIVIGVGAVALAWQGHRLVRDPGNARIWTVTGAIFGGTVAGKLGSGPGSIAQRIDDWLGAGAGKLVGGAALFFVNFMLITFFLLVTGDRQRIRAQTGIWLAATATQAVLFSLGGAEPVPATGTMSPASLANVVLTGLYVSCYCCPLLARFALRHARVSSPPLSTGLRVMAVTFLGRGFLGALTDFVYIPFRFAGHPLPAWLTAPPAKLMTTLYVLFLASVVYPGAVRRLATLRRGWAHHRAYRDLEPLWKLLHEAFPDNTLRPSPATGIIDRLAWRGVHRRYYRRTVECRDGLVLISPYLPAPHAEGRVEVAGHAEFDPIQQAADLRAALRLRAQGLPPPRPTVGQVLAEPTAPGIDGDTAQLLALSRALAGR